MEIEDEITNMINQVDGDVGIYIKSLNEKEEIVINGDKQFITASVFKIFLAVKFLQQVDNGIHKLDTSYTIKESDKILGSGILMNLNAGLKITLEDLFKLMIMISDNTATDIIMNLVGLNNLQEMLNELNLKNTEINLTTRDWLLDLLDMRGAESTKETFIEAERRLSEGKLNSKAQTIYDIRDSEDKVMNNISSPNDTGKFLELLINGELLSDSSTKLLIDSMKKQSFKYFIASDIPPEIHVADKPGALPGIKCDSGIIFLQNSPIIISIYTNKVKDEMKIGWWQSGSGVKIIQKVSKIVYDHYKE